MKYQLPQSKYRRATLIAGTTLPLALLTGVLWAQPDANNAGKAGNPNNLQMGGGPPGMNMTAEQRAQLQAIQDRREAQNREESVRTTLITSGYTDKALQDAVVAFVNEQTKRLTPLKEQIQKVRELLNVQGATDAQTATALNNLREAAETERANRDTAEQALNAKISYSKKPKLEALLTVMGVIGQESALSTTSSVLGNGGGGMGGGMGGPGGGMGGFGGGQGGPGGGFGGRGGGQGGPGGGGQGGPGGEMGPPPGGPGGNFGF